MEKNEMEKNENIVIEINEDVILDAASSCIHVHVWYLAVRGVVFYLPPLQLKRSPVYEYSDWWF